MMSKRYSFNWERGHPNFWDNYCDLADCYLTCEDVCERLNAIYEDNIELNKLLDSVENIVQTSIQDEKTAFGSMVLKQLADKLGVDYD